jgi:hypothetical protein
MPPFGVAEALVDSASRGTALTGTDLFQFWLLTHDEACVVTGSKFWRTAVLHECLPRAVDVDAGLQFVALAPPLRHYPRVALVRVDLDEEPSQ